MQKIVMGNWKMHGDAAMAGALVQAIVQQAAAMQDRVQVVVCPPAVLLASVGQSLSRSKVSMGGQDCHTQPEGAFTGDISAPMLRQFGCSHVLVGHSERRKFHHEGNAEVSQKAAQAIKTGLVPVICIGETAQERDQGKTKDVVGQQVRESIPPEAATHDFILAYEPVWAIGSGKTPTPDDIQEVHDYIISVASRQTGLPGGKIRVLYGGSVKADNARQMMALDAVAGVLVGGASLKADEFCRIIAAAA